MNRTTKSKAWITDIIIFLSLSVIAGIGVIYRLGTEYMLLKLLLIIGFLDGIYAGILYIISGRLMFLSEYHYNKETVKYKVIISIAIIFTYMPIMVFGYFFHDDWLNFNGGDFLGYSITQARPVTGLFTDLAGKITIENSCQLSFLAVAGLIIYIEIIFDLLSELISKEKAMILSLMLAFLTPVVNVLGYKVMYIYIYSAVFSSLSLLFFYKASDKTLMWKYRILCLIISAFFLIYSNMIYQVTATIAFFVVAALCLYGKKEKDNVNLYFIIYYICSTGIYFLLSKLLQSLYHTELMTRSSMISSITDIKDKILFFCTVLLENIKQLLSSFTYNICFTDNDFIWMLNYKNFTAETAFAFFCCACIIVCFYSKFIKQKRWLGCAVMAATIPLSYYPFLILKESSYTSYYSISLCSILLITVIDGLTTIPNFFKVNISWKFLALLCCMEMICANIYMSRFWVISNKEPYDYIVHELQQHTDLLNETKWIHVYGTVRLGQADIYAIKEMERAIEEYNLINTDVKITTSDKESYSSSISYETYSILKSNFSEEDEKLWEELYIDVSQFSLYTLDPSQLTDEKIDQLESIFKKSKLIPEEGQAVNIYLNIN